MNTDIIVREMCREYSGVLPVQIQLQTGHLMHTAYIILWERLTAMTEDFSMMQAEEDTSIIQMVPGISAQIIAGHGIG